MSGLRLFLLGPPRIERDGVPLELHYRKNLALIAYLAVTGKRYTREALVTLLWPDVDPSRARANLRRDLSTIRKALGGKWLVVDRETVELERSTGFWLDVDRFRYLLSAWQGHGHPQTDVCPRCLDDLAEAVELYRGDFLTGFSLRDSVSFDDWQSFQTEELRLELASALERLVRGHSAQGAYESAIPYARRWLALDPLHEPVHCHLMGLYAQTGQRAAALHQYQECVRVLEAELGLPPSKETTSLYEHIRAQPDGQAALLLPLPSPKHNLPVQTTPFVGREEELAELGRLLSDPDVRLVTVLGPGGMGKTRLALEAAQGQVDRFADGVYWASLAPLQTVEAIVPTVAGAMGFPFSEGRVSSRQQLLDYLYRKQMLLLLDNCEHLLSGMDIVTDVLRTTLQVKVLATSRIDLSVQGEHRFPIGGLFFPDGGTPEDALEYSAVRLFAQSARRAQPGFKLQADDLKHVTRICQLVEGMPLGILLAASWLAMLTPAEIAAELAQSLDFLETDLRDVPERQRSIRAVFDRSWDLLCKREQVVFRTLSVFRGGFTREAAQAVAGTDLHELMALVDKSLIHRTSDGRYEVHELLRQYAQEKLEHSPDEAAVRDRHSAYYTTALQRWEADLKGPRQKTALVEMKAEIENARAAWHWAVEQGQVERLSRAMDGLCRLYIRHGRTQEGEATCQEAAERLSSMARQAVTACDDRLRVLARLWTWQSDFCGYLRHTELEDQLLRQSLSLLDGPELADEDTRAEKAFLLYRMGYKADFKRGKQLLEQSLALYKELGDRWSAALVLRMLARSAWGRGDYAELIERAKEAQAISRWLGDRGGIAGASHWLSCAACYQGRAEDAEQLARESLAIYEELGNQSGHDRYALALALCLSGKYAEAHSLMEDALAMFTDQGDRVGADSIFPVYQSMVAMELGLYKQARALAQKGLGVAREERSWRGVGYTLCILGSVALAEGAREKAQQLLEESIAAYRETEMRDELAWALACAGLAALGLGQSAQARQYLGKALRTGAETGTFAPVITALPVTALLLADQGKPERAVELYALASRHPHVANSRWFEDVAGRHITAAAETLPPDAVAAAQERGRARDLEATVQELLAELEAEVHYEDESAES
jgi:predicted ATPase/DNA-binding SARP family transcriptional activator